jgi:polysaccharide chain length determinant protein (PEP-CTERM system associated)
LSGNVRDAQVSESRELLVNNVVETFVDEARRIARVTLKRRWLALGASALVATASIAGISLFMEKYHASARVYVDTQTVLKPLMASLTYQPDVEQQVSMLARTLISRPNVEKLVDTLGLASSAEMREATVSRLMNEIKVAPTGSGGNLYDISYRGPSREGARQLVDATVQLFVHAGAGAKKRDSQEAGKFIEEQIKTYEAKLVESENRLKNFKVRNFGVSGVSNQDYFTRVSTLSEDVSRLRVELSAAEQSRDSYRRELAAEEPQLPIDTSSSFAVPSEAETRLEAQKRNLDDLLRRYTDAHPDVVSARRLVAQLETEAAQRREEAKALSRGGKGGRAATSPVYQKLRISLAESEAHTASLRSQLSAKQALLDQVRSVAGRVPQVEAELVQLNRDYEIIRKNYDQMVSRRESALLGVKLDESSQLAEFRVVEPPRVLPSAVFPSRLHLALIAFVLSLVAGIVAAATADLIWPTFEEKAALAEFSGRPVLGTVSMLVTPEGTRRQRASVWRFAAAFGFLMAIQGAWLAWISIKPTIG